MFTLQVDRELEIRQLEEDHADALFALVESNRLYLRQWLPWVDKTTSVQNVREYIRNTAAGFDRNEQLSAGIWYHDRLCGGLGWHKIDWNSRKTSLGYWLDQALQGRGIVTRCCRRLIDHLTGALALHRIEIHCATGNGRSCAVAKRLGFEREGVLREAEWVNDRFLDLVVWGMLAREWQRTN